MNRTYLGIDPGFADMGYGVIRKTGAAIEVVTYGSVTTSKDMPSDERLAAIHDELSRLVRRFSPDEVGVERLFFAKNAKTAMDVAEARGVIRLCLRQLGVGSRELYPNEVKMAVCGHGAAQKKEMQKMVKMLLGLKEVPKPDDAADALAIALALAYTRVPATRT